MKNILKFSHCSLFVVLFLALQIFSFQFSIAEELTTKESISFGDILALQAQGLLPRYDYVRKVKKDKSIDWGHTTGERDEIGLLPEQHAAYIAGQSNLLPSILQTALKPPPSAISHEHKPNLYWLPYLMTGDVQYVRNMEATWKQFKDWRHMPYDSSFDYYDQGRHLAWTLRDLAQLAYLQKLGVTEHDYYIPALEASHDYFINRTKNSMHKRWNVLGFNYITEDSFGWTSWMESFVGQALNHVVSLGFKDWKLIAEFQYKNLEKRSGGEWPLKDVDSDHIFFQHFNKTLSGKALQGWAKTQTWQDITAYPPWMVKKFGYQKVPDDQLVPADRQINGNFFTYRQRVQYAYAWAALACGNKITGACDKARELMKAITKRGDQWGVKNKILFEPIDRYVKPAPTKLKPKSAVRKKGYWKGWDNLPLDEFVLVPNTGGASNIGKLLKEAGFGREKYKGSVRGSFTAWVGAAHDLDSGVIYVPWGGGMPIAL